MPGEAHGPNSTRQLAAVELALLFPATLFLTALLVRGVLPVQPGPAHAAQEIVMWYAGRTWTLWLLLIALPLAALVTGCAALLRRPLATRIIAATTLAAASILGIVVLHMLAN
jgi:hypothetical protein